MPIEQYLRWNKESERQLKNAINDFNKKVKNLRKTRKDKSYLPEEIDYEATKDLITTRNELNRVIESLGRFKGTQAFKKVTLPSGEALTNWEVQEIKLQQIQAERRIKRRMQEIRRNRPEYFTGSSLGNEEYKKLQNTLKSIKSFGLKKPSGKLTSERIKEISLEARRRIENWGSMDFEMRRAIVYKENYLRMFTETYVGLSNYDKVLARLKSIENPIQFYNILKKLEEGEKLKDISFMYEATPFQETLNKLALNLGMEIEDSETIEEGE